MPCEPETLRRSGSFAIWPTRSRISSNAEQQWYRPAEIGIRLLFGSASGGLTIFRVAWQENGLKAT